MALHLEGRLLALQGFRRLFPLLRTHTYLNAAAEGPVSLPVAQAMAGWVQDQMYQNAGDQTVEAACRERLARLIGAGPEDIALMPHTSAGVATVAQGLDWRPGDNVVLPRGEYVSNAYPYLALARRGVCVRWVDMADGVCPPERIAAQMDNRTRLVAVSAVQYLNGYRHDLKDLADLVHRRGALLAVDGIQALGVSPIDVREQQVDFLMAGSYKWLLGPLGAGFLYVCRQRVTDLGLSASGWATTVSSSNDVGYAMDLWPGARRFESGTLSLPVLAGWNAALDVLQEAGLARIQAQVAALVVRAEAGLNELGYRLFTTADPAHRAGILCFSAGDPDANARTLQRAERERVVISLRGQGQVLRLSAHLYNDAADIDTLLRSLGPNR